MYVRRFCFFLRFSNQCVWDCELREAVGRSVCDNHSDIADVTSVAIARDEDDVRHECDGGARVGPLIAEVLSYLTQCCRNRRLARTLRQQRVQVRLGAEAEQSSAYTRVGQRETSK